GETSSAGPEDHQARVAIHLLPGKDWAESKAMARRVMTARAVLEDSDARFWLLLGSTISGEMPPPQAGAPATPSSPPPAGGAPAGAAPNSAAASAAPAGKPGETSWYVSVPGPLGPCTAQVTFKDPTFEETARTIAESVAAVVPVP